MSANMPKPTVFIGSSKEGLNVARAIQAELQNDAACSVWNQGIFSPGSFTLEVLEQEAATRDFAILVLTPDVLQTSRSQNSYAPRPNLLFELGLFMGRLGRKRVFAIQNRNNPLDLSDLYGLTLLKYESAEPDGLRSAVATSCSFIREAIRTNGSRAATPLLVDRQHVHGVVGSIANRLASARSEVRISGFDCKFVVLEQTAAIEAALTRGVRIKILCLDPESSSVVELLQKVPSHSPSVDDLRRAVAYKHPLFYKWRTTFSDLFEVRFLHVLPVVGMFIADPANDGVIKVELYTHEQRHGDISRPHLIIPSSIGSWRNYLLRQWELYWNSSRVPNDSELELKKTPTSAVHSIDRPTDRPTPNSADRADGNRKQRGSRRSSA